MQRITSPAASDSAVQARSLGASLRSFLTYQPSKRVKPTDVVLFCRQLASFVRVGVPVTTAIETFAEQSASPKLRQVYAAIVSALERGGKLSDAFAEHPLVFPSIVVDMVRSAEMTGNLDSVLRQAAKSIEREAQARQKIRAAMIYPIIIASFGIVITIGMVAFVLPKFKDLYASLNVPLPGILKFLLNTSTYVGDHELFIILGILLAIVGTAYWARTDRGRLTIDSALLRMPVIGPLIRTSTTERFCRTLGDMLTAGVPISQTYPVVISNVRNRVLKNALAKVGPAMAAGRGIYRPLSEAAVFSPAVIQMIRVGEETGNLDSNLAEAADMHEEELDYRIKRMTAVLEPSLIVFVGLMVGFIAVTMITSIYSLAGNFQ